MPSEESIESQKEFLRRRRKATRIGMKKLAKQDDRKAEREREEIERRPFHKYELEITRNKRKNDDPYDINAMLL